MKRLLFALCLLPSLVFGANIDFRNLNTNHFTTNLYRVGLKSIPTNQTIAEYVTGTTNGLFILRQDGFGTNTTITNFNVNGAVKRPGTQLVHFAAVDFQLTRTATDQVASGYASLIGPGSLRSSARAIYSVVLNGFDNHVLVTGERSIIVGGQENTNGAPFSSIFGVGNYTSSNSAGNLFVTGSHNRAEDLATDSGIIAGSDNQIAGLSTDVFILSSYISRIVDSSVAAIITAESGYITNGSYATIVGGIGNRNFNSTGGFQGGGTSSTLTNAPGSFTLGSSITIRAGNAGGLGFNLTNDIEGTVHMGNGELGNWFYADKTNAYLVGALKLVQANAAATAITTAGAVGIGTNAPTEELEVRGNIKMRDGTEGASKLLADSGAGTGIATWQAITNLAIGPVGFEDSVPYLTASGTTLASSGLRWIEAERYLRVNNIGSEAAPVTNVFSQNFTGIGSEPGLMLLRNSNLVGAVGFTHSGPSSASNIFNFAGVTNPVAGQILKIHSVSGNVVTLTNDVDGAVSIGALTGVADAGVVPFYDADVTSSSAGVTQTRSLRLDATDYLKWGGEPNASGVVTNQTVTIPSALVVSNGFASYSTVAAVSIAAAGWTNVFSPPQNAVVYINAGAADLAFYVKNNAGTPVFTNANNTGVVATVVLQPRGAVVITGGTTPTGIATPF